jgi:hypothetical protein
MTWGRVGCVARSPHHTKETPVGFMQTSRSGTLLQARRQAAYDEGGTPPSLFTSASVWLKADALALSNGADVITWPDSSSHGHDATRGGGGQEPLYQTNQINSLPAVFFNSSNLDYLTLPSSADFTCASGTFSWFAVLSLSAGASGRRSIFRDRPLGAFGTQAGNSIEVNNGNFDSASNGTEDDAGNARTVTLTLSLQSAGWCALRVDFDGSTYRVQKNLTSVQTGGTSPAGSAPLGTITPDAVVHIGANPGGGRYFAGSIAELLYYNTLLADSDIAAVRDYLLDKYGL